MVEVLAHLGVVTVVALITAGMAVMGMVTVIYLMALDTLLIMPLAIIIAVIVT
jgi:hypothetical protein